MKRTLRNNILRYAIATVFVAAFLLTALLVCMGLDWLTDITGWPIFPIAVIVAFIYTVWFVGKGITIKNDKEEQQ